MSDNVGPDLGPNCLQKLSADKLVCNELRESCHIQGLHVYEKVRFIFLTELRIIFSI